MSGLRVGAGIAGSGTGVGGGGAGGGSHDVEEVWVAATEAVEVADAGVGTPSPGKVVVEV